VTRSPIRGALAALLLAALVAVAGCSDGGGSADVPPGVDRVVDVTMTEMKFDPDDFSFKVGETIMFRFHNEGRVRHEAVIGDQSAQDAAVAAMAALTTTTTPSQEGARGRSRVVLSHPGMGLPNLISVEPGRTGTITFQFAKPTTLLMQCHETGHLEAGMTGTITITP
jgi:uncharacterized cupredoxin-like copper-binding protein